MSQLSEQMQRLAKEIGRTREERKAFLAENQKRLREMRADVASMRSRLKLELAHKATQIARTLDTFNRQNQRTVSGSLRNLRIKRASRTRQESTARRMDVLKNRQEVAKVIRKNHTERLQSSKELKRACLATIQSVKSRVRAIRIESHRQLQSYMSGRRVPRPVSGHGSHRPLNTLASLKAGMSRIEEIRLAAGGNLSPLGARPNIATPATFSSTILHARRSSPLPVPPTR